MTNKRGMENTAKYFIGTRGPEVPKRQLSSIKKGKRRQEGKKEGREERRKQGREKKEESNKGWKVEGNR